MMQDSLCFSCGLTLTSSCSILSSEMTWIFFLGCFNSKAFHSLVHHALSSGSSSDAESKEEALAVYQDICEIIENQAKVKDIIIDPTLVYAKK